MCNRKKRRWYLTEQKKSTEEKQNSANIMISVDWKGTVDIARGIVWNFADIKKENFKKYLKNSVETNEQINMTSDHSLSSNNSFKSYLNAKSSNVRNIVILLQCLLQGWSERMRVIWIQLREKTERKPQHQQMYHLIVIEIRKFLI